MSSAVQISPLTWLFTAEPSTIVQSGPRALLAEALAVLVCSMLSEPTSRGARTGRLANAEHGRLRAPTTRRIRSDQSTPIVRGQADPECRLRAPDQRG
jgi:hypothetical protein